MTDVAAKNKSKSQAAKSRRQTAKQSSILLPRKLGGPSFRQLYWLVALGILLATSAFTAVLGAKVQQGNSDQLVDAYFFQDNHTLQGAIFPGQHIQLLKWPLFYLIKLLGYSEKWFVIVTVACVLVTVGFLAYILQRIERRPLVSGTLYLALASVLLLVPPQPYARGLLPVNMAMLTTRNIEYILLIGSLALLARFLSFRSRRFWLAVAALTLLIASDKLFLTLALGGAILALIVYSLKKRWLLASLSVNWLVAVCLSILGSALLVGLISATGLTHIVNQTGSGPYGLVTSLKNIILGIIYGVAGLFTNLGANPAFDATALKQIPHQLFHHLFSVAGFSLVVNFGIAIFGLWIIYRLIMDSLFAKSLKNRPPSAALNLSLMLAWTTAAALGVFIMTNHYYAVDARYLGICLFTIFIAVAVYGRHRSWSLSIIRKAGLVLGLSIFLGLFAALSNFHDEKQALASYDQRNKLVTQVLASHPVYVLVGDYWRVLPIKDLANPDPPIMPLQNCTQPRSSLTDKAWSTDLHTHSFAYLLSFDKGLTDYPQCSVTQVVKAYGRPNTSVLITGTLEKPQEALLFYDKGIHGSDPKIGSQTQTSTVLPVPLNSLVNINCQGPTIMNLVAHQDDDLLFLSPELLHEIKAGDCIRTVYLTAGDAGSSNVYWLGREQGSEAAYAKMIGSRDVWIQRIVKLPGGQFAMIANPYGNSKISLIFLRLPDGSPNGNGFPRTHNESLAKLEANSIKNMQAVDGQSNYSVAQLTAALTALMYTYQPTAIQTQSNLVSAVYPDHSDHMAVGRFVQQAYRQYEAQQYSNIVTIPLKFYTGYPSHNFPPNVTGADLKLKEATFLTYALYDGAVCHTIDKCLQSPSYGSYLTRSYQEPY